MNVQMGSNITIKVDVRGFPENITQQHGFHVHTNGDISNQCANAAGPYDPTGVSRLVNENSTFR